MKKWFIFALIAAVFMVTFTACNKDEEGDDGLGLAGAISSDTSVFDDINGFQSLIVTWNGVPGYDYYVYFEQRDISGVITPLAVSGIKGQTLFGIDPIDEDPYWQRNKDTAGKNKWSIAISSVAGKHFVGNPTDWGLSDGKIESSVTVLEDLDALITTINEEVIKDTKDRVVWYRVGVGAANPGGFPMIRQRSVMFENKWF